ncbi:LysR family transcriptional regulator [Ectobacillus funiculus]|uniref:LysR family transcriptional regulator n=1 Tax=Ectobacillus funiculus TaxID=137993 RepID=A0ABV5WJW8_9BACI
MSKSAAAIIKQMNLLEAHIGVHILIRTNHGTRLTDAGKSLYKVSQFLMQYYEEVSQRAGQIVSMSSV